MCIYDMSTRAITMKIGIEVQKVQGNNVREEHILYGLSMSAVVQKSVQLSVQLAFEPKFFYCTTFHSAVESFSTEAYYMPPKLCQHNCLRCIQNGAMNIVMTMKPSGEWEFSGVK